MKTLAELVLTFQQVRNERLSLQKQADELKTGREEELKVSILNMLAAQGLTSAKIEGVGVAGTRETFVYTIQDPELFAKANFESVLEQAQKGHPFMDGTLYQGRVHREGLEALLDRKLEQCGPCEPSEAQAMTSQFLAQFGVALLPKTDLFLRK